MQAGTWWKSTKQLQHWRKFRVAALMGVTKAVPVAARQWRCAGPWRGQRATVNYPQSGEPAQGKAHLCIHVHVWVIRYIRDMYMCTCACACTCTCILLVHVHATQRQHTCTLKQWKYTIALITCVSETQKHLRVVRCLYVKFAGVAQALLAAHVVSLFSKESVN